MNGSIRFPHLGITLDHVIKSVSIGGFEIACYGIVLALAMVTGLLLAMRVAKATGQDPDKYFDLGLTAIVASVICARIYYVVFSWDYYREHLAEIVNLRQGGLAILAVVRTARSKESVVAVALPTLSKAVPWAQVAMG